VTVRLNINVDHVATLRQARGTSYPDPLEAAQRALRAGADGITIHLREDRRHIQDDDVRRICKGVDALVNLEMACVPEMVAIALEVRPEKVTLVPERREERTTEGGLDVFGAADSIRAAIASLKAADIPTSLFIDPEPKAVLATAELGAAELELHTGDYADALEGPARDAELDRLVRAGKTVSEQNLGLVIAAGHGLTVANVPALLRAAPEIVELNIGHAVVSDAVMVGFEPAVAAFLAVMAT
jgi:pyridoxine 5-phosphate synthase